MQGEMVIGNGKEMLNPAISQCSGELSPLGEGPYGLPHDHFSVEESYD